MTKEGSSPTLSTETFLEGGGELGARMRQTDWTATPLGPPESWPQSLKTAVRITLTCRQPMFVWWGPELINLYNDAYRQILGGKHPAALGQPAFMVWQEIWDQVGPRAESAMRRNEGTYDEALLLIMERNGYAEETYFTFSYSPVPNDEGGTGGILCANTDDTRRIIGERQLKLLRDLAAGTSDCRTIVDACTRSARRLESDPFDIPFALIYLQERDGKQLRLQGAAGISRTHPAAPEVVTVDQCSLWPFAEVLGEHHTRLVTDLSAIPDLPKGAWHRPPSQAAVVPINPAGTTGQGGVLIVGLSPFRLFDDGYRGFIELAAGQIAASITSAQTLEEERRRAEALAELDRAKTAFFSNVSHEFRTPLTLLLGPIEEIINTADEDELSPAARDMLTVAYRNGRRLQKLVNTLLDFSRIEAGRVEAIFEPTDLGAATADLASVFRSAVEKAGLRLLIDCPRLAAPAYVDRDMWEKIVLNLISNAFKYTLSGTIRVTARVVGPSVVVEVQDTGTGIPESELPKLFDRFHRVQGVHGRTHEGTGIGLALVQELVKMHGGSVSAASVFGEGSTFTVRIPVGRDHLPRERVSEARTLPVRSSAASSFLDEAANWMPLPESDNDFSQSTGQSGVLLRNRPHGSTRPRIVLADDNADMRDYVRRLLSNDYDVTVASDGRAALQAVVEHRPDLVLTDAMMPRLDGFGLLGALRSDTRTATVPVIMLSARAGEESRVEGLEAGADDYLVKPFSARELLARIKGVLALARVRHDARKREEELRAESANILESLSEGFVSCDAEWRITSVNREGERMTGIKREALIGQSLWVAAPSGVGPTFEAAFRRAMTERTPTHVEDYYAPFDRWFEAHAFPVLKGGLAIFFQDVTERRQSQSAFREIEARFTRFMHHLPGLAWIKDDRGRYVFANDAAMRAFGRPAEELYGRTDHELFPNGTAREFGENDQAALESEAGIQTEEALIHPDGSVHHSLVNKFSIPAGATGSTLIGGMAIDITERKKAEAALRESEARFRQMADNAPVLIWVNGPDGCEFVNREYLRFLGVPFESVQGMNWTQFAHPEDIESYLASYRRAQQARQNFDGALRFRRHDGQYRWLRSSGVPRMSSDGTFLGYVGCSFDVTEIKRSEDALREADRRKDEFLAMLAHELRNPLAPIRSGLDLLAAQGVEDESISLMRDQVEHLVRMVDDLLDASRILRNRIQLRKKPVELTAAVQRAVESVRPHIEAQQHELAVSTPSRPVWVDADPVRLTQVAANLLHNAAKYTERNGRIEVSIHEAEGQATLTVRDNGVGISPDLLPKVFELFTQADRSLERSQGGLGIGLTLVQSLVTLHGGSVVARSEGEGHGAEFTVRLPAISSPQPVVAGIVEDMAKGEFRILVVEDNVGSAKILSRLLKTLGNHEVHLAHDGMAAVESARTLVPDMILLDIGLPRMNGFEVARMLRSEPRFHETMLVALTGYGADEDRRRSREAGFDMHLIKPPSIDVLQHLFAHPRLGRRRHDG